VLAHISAKTLFEMMFMLPQMTDVHYPASIHVQLPTRYQCQNVSCSVLTSYQHNDLGLQGQCYLDWEKVSIEFKHNDSSKGLLFQSCYA
jgi:hypothetical protein